jgi:hypothetical protein
VSQSETILTMVLALFVVASIFLISQQIVRERGTQDENERLRKENELLRRENTMLIVGNGRLTAQIENMEGIPVWRAPNGTITPYDKDPFLNAMQTLFTKEELMLLADDAGLNYDHVAAQSLPGIARELMEQARHRGIEVRLKDAVKNARPNAHL